MTIYSKCFYNTNFEPTTLVELLLWRVANQPDQRAYTFLADHENTELEISYQSLDQNARKIGAWLQSMGLAGERALLIYPPGIDYILAFFGCLYAGVIAVPAYPPDPERLNRTLPRLQAIAKDCQAKIVLTTDSILKMMKIINFGARVSEGIKKIPLINRFQDSLNKLISQQSGIFSDPVLRQLSWYSTEDKNLSSPQDWQPPNITTNSLAFIQYTSGSTGTPKGVMISHQNLLYNLALIYNNFEYSSSTEGVIWLPMYHDMGLIGGILQPLYGGVPCTLLSPITFLQRPLVWLQIISQIKNKKIISGGPNFAYDLCIRKTTPEQRAKLDLSHWDIAFSGAEPVRPQTLNQFYETFKSCGFKSEVFYPCYGLAEATLMVSGGIKHSSVITANFNRLALEKGIVAAEESQSKTAVQLVSCGQNQPGQKIRIINPATLTLCQPDEIGEIWITGPSVAQGYWGRNEDTEQIFNAYVKDTGEGPFLRTGDLGFLKEGELFITGRSKDLIIIRGRNHYPQDIELTVEQSHPALRPGCGAAFSIEEANEERLVIVQEIRSNRKHSIEEIVNTIRQAVVEAHDIHPYAVVLIEPRTIPKTSSGKIQRQQCKAEYLAQTLKVVNSSILSQSEFLVQEDGLTRESLISALPEKRKSLIESHLLNQTSKILKIMPSQLSTKQPLIGFGIDSLTAVELSSEIESTLGIRLPMESIISGESIEEITNRLLDDLSASCSTPQPTTTKPEATDQLSVGQKALWFLQNLTPESTAYNIVRIIHIPTKLNFDALHNAFQKLVDRHAILRTTFSVQHGEPIQIVHEQMSVFFKTADAANWNMNDLNERLNQVIHQPFDLEKGPLIRIHILSKSSDDHFLALSIHHIISDLWSLATMLRELGILYAAESADRKLSLTPPKISYTDYVNWQNDLLAGATGELLWQYWQNKLSGDLPTLHLPTDRPRSSFQIYKGAIHTIPIDEELTRNIRKMCKQQAVTLYTMLLTAFKVLLYRYTGQQDIILGSPKLGRSRKFMETVGYFVNPIVVRSNLSGNPTFLNLLHQLKKSVLEAFQHGDFPFALLVERLNPSRHTGQAPIFQVMFSLQKTASFIDSNDFASFILGESGGRIELGDLILESVPLKNRVTPFELSMLVAEQGDELMVEIEYSADLFTDRTIEQMLSSFKQLLKNIFTSPDQNISTLPILSESEQILLEKHWSQPQASASSVKDQTIQQFFEAQVAKTPDAIAIIHENQQLSYRSLNQLANQLAHYLKQWGVGPEVLVGVYTEQPIDMIIALLAIFKTGGAYLPLDPGYPEARLKYMIENANVPIILTQSQLVDSLPKFDRKVICLDSQRANIMNQSSENLINEIPAESIAYIIYTSGSTGAPKGVLISYEAITSHCLYVRDFYQLSQADRTLQFASFNFDASLEQVLSPLLAGATLILRGSAVWGPDEFKQKITDYGITVINPPTAYWDQFMQAADHFDINVQLRLVIVGGDLMTRDSLKLWQKKSANGTKLLNAYGPTETTITSTIYEIPQHENGDGFQHGVPIGRPLGLRSTYILDNAVMSVPIGVIGELHIGGECLARGYLNRADLTAERFIPDPFSEIPGARLYRTGDLVRFLSDGNIEFIGRKDHQVKLRGFRVELNEIETVLNQHPKIADSAVILREDKPGDKRLAAYLVTPDELDLMEIRNYLQQRLPDYMIPSNFKIMASLPKTPIGKVDRKVLPQPDRDDLNLTKNYVPPTNQVEQQIAGIWKEILNIEQVGIYDNFFDLGGHSLMATQITTRIKEIFHVNVALKMLFESPTVANLALIIAEAQAEKVGNEAELDQMLNDLQDLSDDEIEIMLKEE